MTTVSFKDLTLREGQQVPGLEIPNEAGKRVLDALAELEIGCVEVAFPRAQKRTSWFRYADDLGLRTAALARAVPADVDAALTVEPDEVEVIITTSDVQLEHALGKGRDEAMDLLEENLRRALSGAEAGATLMDAIRADNDFLQRGARLVEEVGGRHVTLADTTGSGTPEDVRETVTAVRDAVDIDVAVHTHDDLGVAAANSLTGVTAGADSVDATVGGIGERVGNAPLEEVAVLLRQSGHTPALTTPELVPACRRVYDALGIAVPQNKPVLGDHAYRHESGMHTAAMLRDPATYEPFDPSDYGGHRELLFGNGTGRGAVRALLRDVETEVTDETVASALAAIGERATEKGEPLTRDEATEAVRSSSDE